MKKTFNVKTIKSLLTDMYNRVNDDNYPETTNDYIKLWDSFHTMHQYGFLTWDEWSKIYDFDNKLWTNNN